MAGAKTPHFHNSQGHAHVEIGVREYMCVGALPPHDHPHVFLDMGDDSEKVCPYCSTLFVYNDALDHQTTVPDGCVFETSSKAA